MFNLSPNERIAVFIDGSNFFAVSKSLDFDIDYVRLLGELKKSAILVRAYYYTALPDTAEYSPIRKLADFLAYNGYTVVSKPTREFYNYETGHRRIKGNMDMELALDMMKLSEHIDHVVLFSGDGDFCRLLQEVQDKGVRVTVVSSIEAKVMSDPLRRQTDSFIEVEDIKEFISRPPKPADQETTQCDHHKTANVHDDLGYR